MNNTTKAMKTDGKEAVSLVNQVAARIAEARLSVKDAADELTYKYNPEAAETRAKKIKELNEQLTQYLATTEAFIGGIDDLVERGN